jgi:competence protein ComGC
MHKIEKSHSSKTKASFKSRVAFTLAEVLITLGIIGVVAALSIPQLMTHYKKTRTETALKHFYALINNAFRLSSVDNGDPDGWLQVGGTSTYARDVQFMEQYIYPYMKHGRHKRCRKNDGQDGVCVELLNGYMWFDVDANGGDIIYYPIQSYDKWSDDTLSLPDTGFSFQFSKLRTNYNASGINNADSRSFIEPYIYDWDGRESSLKTASKYGCRKGNKYARYCTKLLQVNGWKFPKDYPW